MEEAMLKKKFLKTKCQVSFELAILDDTERVNLVGDFNNWDTEATPMEKKGKKFVATVDLDLNRDYQYRYLIDGHEWRNDEAADKYVQNAFNGDNSVISTYAEPVMA